MNFWPLPRLPLSVPRFFNSSPFQGISTTLLIFITPPQWTLPKGFSRPSSSLPLRLRMTNQSLPMSVLTSRHFKSPSLGPSFTLLRRPLPPFSVGARSFYRPGFPTLWSGFLLPPIPVMLPALPVLLHCPCLFWVVPTFHEGLILLLLRPRLS